MQGFGRNCGAIRVLGACVGLAVLAGCGHTEWHYVALRDVQVSLPSISDAEPPVRRAGMPGEPLSVAPGGQRCVLVATETHEDPERLSREWGRAFVVVLDGPPGRGKVNVSPENGRLISTSPRRPARQPYVGLEGYVNILSVTKGAVHTYCVLRSEIRDAYDDSFVLRGFYDFQTATGNEAFLRRGGIDVAGPLQ